MCARGENTGKHYCHGRLFGRDARPTFRLDHQGNALHKPSSPPHRPGSPVPQTPRVLLSRFHRSYIIFLRIFMYVCAKKRDVTRKGAENGWMRRRQISYNNKIPTYTYISLYIYTYNRVCR